MSRDQMGNVLEKISKYGLSTVLLFLIIYQVLIPMKDGHLLFLDRTATAIEAVARAMEKQSDMMQDQGKETRKILERLDARDAKHVSDDT